MSEQFNNPILIWPRAGVDTTLTEGFTENNWAP